MQPVLALLDVRVDPCEIDGGDLDLTGAWSDAADLDVEPVEASRRRIRGRAKVKGRDGEARPESSRQIEVHGTAAGHVEVDLGLELERAVREAAEVDPLGELGVDPRDGCALESAESSAHLDARVAGERLGLDGQSQFVGERSSGADDLEDGRREVLGAGRAASVAAPSRSRERGRGAPRPRGCDRRSALAGPRRRGARGSPRRAAGVEGGSVERALAGGVASGADSAGAGGASGARDLVEGQPQRLQAAAPA